MFFHAIVKWRTCLLPRHLQTCKLSKFANIQHPMPVITHHFRTLLPYLMCTGIACIALFPAGSSLAGQPAGQAPGAFVGMTFDDLVNAAIEAFSSQRLGEAASLFDELESTFGREPEFTDEDLQRAILPAWGYALLVSDNAPRAVEIFERFLAAFPTAARQRPFVLFSLALAHRRLEDPERAYETYTRFIAEFPERAEAGIAILRQAEIRFQQSRSNEGLELLENYYTRPDGPDTLKAQARIRALKEALAIEDLPYARNLLLDTDWQIDTMPELGVLAFAALAMGDYLLEQKQFQDAIRSYRLVPPKDVLIAGQKARMEAVRNAFQSRSARQAAGDDAIWRDHYDRLLTRVQETLRQLEEAEDYTPAFLLRYGQAFLLAERPHEAWIVFESLVRDPLLPENIRREAHYRWILAAQNLQRWEDALRIARSYIDLYPDAPDAPMAFFLIANAFQSLQDYKQAVAVLTDIIENYPDHPQRPRWLFTRGFASLLDDSMLAARDDFSRYIDEFPDGLLAPNARLWEALTWFFQKNYPQAHAKLTELLRELPANHPVAPEVRYRLASVDYAQRSYDQALSGIQHFLQNYPGHFRAPEALVLKGDILMGLGQLTEATTVFKQVTPEALDLFPYSVFQVGKIFRAIERYDLMIKHFREYVDRPDIAPKPRLAEALHWVGWALDQSGQPSAAFPVYAEALAHYGDDPQVGEIGLILQGLQKLHRTFLRRTDSTAANTAAAASAAPAPPAPAHPMLQFADFRQWLISERSNALEQSRLTYFARLSVFLSALDQKARRTDEADAFLLEMIENVPRQHMDAEALGEAGLLLARLEFPSARDFFTDLLQRFPGSPQKAAAYYGLAQIAFRQREFTTSRAWLERFRRETPLHPLSNAATLLHGNTLREDGSPEQAIEILEGLLKLKSARGRPHAEALLGIARAEEQRNRPERAIAYYQRVFNLYRAFADLAAQSYLDSARLFEALGDLRAAYHTVREMTFDDRMTAFPELFAQAVAQRDRLAPLLPPEQAVAPESADPVVPETPTRSPADS